MFVVGLFSSCSALGPQEQSSYRGRLGGSSFEPVEYGAPRREWFQLGFSYLDRHADESDPVEDGLDFSVDGGFDVALGNVRPSLELGWAYAPLEVDDGGESDERADVHRVSMGLRVTAELERLRPYARVGLFYRWSEDEDEFEIDGLDFDGSGFYLGGGLDLRVQEGLSFGPFLTWYRETRDDELEELLIGISVTFYP